MNITSPVAHLPAHMHKGLLGLVVALGLLAPAACRPAVELATPTPVPEEAVSGAAVVAVPRAPVRPSPDLLTDPVAWLEQGTVVTLVKKTGDGVWYQVQWPEGGDPAWILVELVTPATAETLTPPPTPTENTPPATLEPIASVTLTRTAAPTATRLPALSATPSPTTTAGAGPTASPTPCVKMVNWPVYIIQPGDTLFSIGLRTGASVSQLMQANCLASDRIFAGEPLYVPVLPPDPPTPTPTLLQIPTPTPILTASPTLIPVGTPTDTPTPLPPDPGDDPTFTPTVEATETLVPRETPTPTATVSN